MAKPASGAAKLSAPDWAAMPTTVALICAECGRTEDNDARGWRGYLVDLDDDGADEVIVFCPCCAAREFGGSDRAE
jgi:hypothetical protein